MTPSTFLPHDWRQPWQWSVQMQRVWWCVMCCVGVGIASPWWVTNWQSLTDAQAQMETTVQQQSETRRHQQRRADLGQQLAQETRGLAQLSDGVGHAQTMARALLGSAQAHALQVTHLSFDALQQPVALRALSLHHLPVRVRMQGAGKAWLTWWAQLSTWAPGASVSSLDVTSGPDGHVLVQFTLLLPQQAELSHRAWALADFSHSAGNVPIDPFSADEWTELQLHHAQQEPSFVTWIGPEQRRMRQPLEAFARERLRYVGWVSKGTGLQALVQVTDAPNAKSSSRLGDTVYRVGVDGYIGQDWGRITAVTPEELRVRELVRNPAGVWSARHVVLPLEGVKP